MPTHLPVRESRYVALALTIALASCQGGKGDGGGRVGLSLSVAPGVTLDSASYSVTGPDAFMQAGVIDVSDSTDLSAVIGGLPAGEGFAITITATLDDGVTTCSGASTFAVIARMTTEVAVHLLCREPPRTGSATVTGTLNVCPSIDALSASPAEVSVGSSLALAAAAHDLDGGPLALVYQWTAASGTISPPGAASPTFTCAVAGRVTVTLTVTDGDCSDEITAIITCSAGDGGPPPPSVKVNEVESNGGVPGDWVEL